MIAHLRLAFAEPLPGLAAQARLAPRPRPGWRPTLPPAARPAAGLLLLFDGARGPTIILTVRGGHLPHHGGQVSLPGGAVEPGESVEQAALREAQEEIGVEPSLVSVLGSLTPLHIPVSSFTLHPVVATCACRPPLQPTAGEVDSILEVPLLELADPSRLRRAVRWRDGRAYNVPFFELAEHQVWGATAMVLSEFLWMLGYPPDIAIHD